MTKQEILGIFEYISTTDDKCASQLTYAVTLLHSSIQTALDTIKDQILEVTTNEQFDELGKLGEYCNGLKEIEAQLIECNMAIKVLKEKEIIPEASYSPALQEPADTIDYSLYAVDNTERHTIDEDFIYSRICRIDLGTDRFIVNSWKDALIDICNYLYSKDPETMKCFVGLSSMNGKRCQYFSYNEVLSADGHPRNIKLKNSDLYVWVHLSANTIAYLIEKIIIEYGYSKKDVIVYLRADYKDRHPERTITVRMPDECF